MSVRADPERARDAFDEAAEWQLRLDDPDMDHAGFEAWLAAHPAHRPAWESVARQWERFGNERDETLRIAAAEALTAARAQGQRKRHRVWGALAALAASLLLAVLVWPLLDATHHYRTGIGEQRSITLADGSRISLDSASEVRVRYRGDARELWLMAGQARFDVAHDPARPFSVHARDRTVTAVGTAFNIDLLEPALVVTLIEGRVRVSDEAAAASTAPVMLRAGEQLVAGAGTMRVAPVEPRQVTAWQSGRLIFENELLASAVERVNRHTRRRIVLAGPGAASLRLSGVFKTEGADRFAEAIAGYLPLVVVEHTPDHVTLASRDDAGNQF